MAGTTDARKVAHMGTLPRASSAPPAAISPDHSPLHQMERISRVKNRVLESGSHGSVGGEDGNVLAYPARFRKRLASRAQARLRRRLQSSAAAERRPALLSDG